MDVHAFRDSQIRTTSTPPLYVREIGTMWQLGVSTGKPCTFGGQRWVIFGILTL